MTTSLHPPLRSSSQSKKLDQLIRTVDHSVGAGSLMRLGDAHHLNISTFSTGSPELDVVLGGGLPKGRIVEMYGSEGGGKTTLALHAIAEIQRHGGIAAFIDAENALDPDYAQAVGVDIKELLICQPDSGEMALTIADQLLRSRAIDLIVVDSVAALCPQAELHGEMGDYHVGAQAHLMSRGLKRLVSGLNMHQTDCTVIFLNQLRYKIGVTYGSPEVTTGGHSLKYYASIRLDVRRIQTLKKGLTEYGIRTRVKVAKNKIAPPFRVVEVDIIFGKGMQGSLTRC